MKYKIITELPRTKKGIDWEKSNGYIIDYMYEDNIYTFKIGKYDKKTKIIAIEYDNKIYTISITNFTRGHIGRITNKITRDFKIEIGQVFNDEKRNLTIIDRKYEKGKNGTNYKKYKYICNKCGNEHWAEESHLLKGMGCNACGINCKKVAEVRSLWSNYKDLCLLYNINEDIAKQYSYGSSKKITITCPFCGKKKKKRIDNIISQGISCECSDSRPYPEKIVTSLLKQLNVFYVYQYYPCWSNKKIYDFYFKFDGEEYIIETHGGQHYRDNTSFKLTLQEEQENDNYKKELAIKNGIKENNYIILDCRKSDLEWIKNSVLNSKLNKMFNLDDVDWLMCQEFAMSNLEKQFCEFYESNKDILFIKDIADKFNYSTFTAYNILKKGNELGWCNFKTRSEQKKIRQEKVYEYVILNKNYNLKQLANTLNVSYDTIKNDIKDFDKKGICNYESILKENKKYLTR